MIRLPEGNKGEHKEVTWGREGSEMDGVGIGGHQPRFMGVRMEGGGSRYEAPPSHGSAI